MSLLQELGAQLRATSDELPTGLVTVAMERLRSATELLNWVRQTSVDPIGVPQLGNATEHAEHAAAALRLAQDAIAAYLARARPRRRRERAAGPGLAGRPASATRQAGSRRRRRSQPPPERLGPWWQDRVDASSPARRRRSPSEVAAERGPADTGELLRRVAAGVRSGDRARLGRDLHAVNASTGLALSAVTPPVLHRLAGDLLGHEPRPEDLPGCAPPPPGGSARCCPARPPAVLDTLLARICRAPAAAGDARPTRPTRAVTSSVLTGVLLARLGRDAATPRPGRAGTAGRRDADA